MWLSLRDHIPTTWVVNAIYVVLAAMAAQAIYGLVK
jgi:hypothetical protein